MAFNGLTDIKEKFYRIGWDMLDTGDSDWKFIGTGYRMGNTLFVNNTRRGFRFVSMNSCGKPTWIDRRTAQLCIWLMDYSVKAFGVKENEADGHGISEGDRA